MKKFRVLLLLLTLLSVSAVSGCKSGENSSGAELGEQINDLKDQASELGQEQDIPSADGVEDLGTSGQSPDVQPVVTDAVSNETNQPTDTNLSATNAVSDTIESLKEDVDKVTANTDSAKPPKDENEKRTKFYELKNELDLVEDRIDAYDDYIEAQQKNGELSYDDYKKQERQLDELEDRLDASEDKLEKAFGIYD